MLARHWKPLCILALAALPAIAQPAPPDDRGGPPPFEQRRGRNNPEARIKEALDLSDDRWKSLQPKITKVLQLQHETTGGNNGGPGGGGPGDGGGPDGGRGPNGGNRPPRDGNGPTSRPARGPGGPGGPATRPARGDGAQASFAAQPHSKVQDRLDDLQEALDDKNVKPEVLKAKVDALHQARAEAKAELTKAQEELRAVLTPTQEATLITMNVLD